MDGRYLGLALCGLLTMLSGCTHTKVAGVRSEGAPTGSASGEDGPVTHKAPTYVAFADMTANVALSPDRSPVQRQQAREEARLAYLKAIETDPKYLPAYLSLARLQQGCEDFAGATSTLTQALQLVPKDPQIWYELGKCQCRQKKWADSVASLRTACELSPGNKLYLTTLGYTLGRMGKLHESLAILTQAQGEAKAHYDLARLMQHMKQTELARRLVILALEKEPELPGARELLASLNGQPTGESLHAVVHTEPVAPASRPGTPVVTSPVATTVPAASTAETTIPTTQASEMEEQHSTNETMSAKPVRLPPLPVRPK